MLLLVIYNVKNTLLLFFITPTLDNVSSSPKLKDDGNFSLSTMSYILSATFLLLHCEGC